MATPGSALAALTQCSLCFEQFDMQDRRPKLMDCAHTYCLDCLTRHVKTSGGAKTCPKCRQPFTEAPFFLKDNYQICESLDELALVAASSTSVENPPSTAEIPVVSLRFFCTRCNRDANDSCLENGHDLCEKTGLVLKRATEAKEQAKRQFQREDGVLKDLAESLEAFAAAINGKGGLGPRAQREMGEVKKQREVLDKTSKLVMEVPLTAFQDNGDVPRALDRFLQANSERLFALQEQKRMLDMAKKCTVTVRADDTGLATGTSKTLAIGPGSTAEDRVLSYLIYLLLHGHEGPTEEDAAGTDTGAAGSSSAVPSLDTLIADVKKCVIDGDDESDNDNEDDSDSDGGDSAEQWVRIGKSSGHESDTSSVVSEVGRLENCRSARRLLVGKIPITVKPEEIKELFSEFGDVLYVRFLTKSNKAKAATANIPKFHRALVYVPDDRTVENILRNRPIAYDGCYHFDEKQGQFGRWLLNVKEDRTKMHGVANAKQQRKTKTSAKKSAPLNSSQDNEAARKVFANQVPLDSTESDLANFFSNYGAVTSVVKVRHGVGQKCMAFITFEDERSVAQIFEARPIMYNGFDLQVREYRDKTTSAPRAQQSASAMVPAPGTSNSQFSWAETMTAAAAATTVAMSTYCIATIERNKQGAQQQQQRPKRQPQQNKQNQQHRQQQHQQPQQRQQRQHQQRKQQYLQKQRHQQEEHRQQSQQQEHHHSQPRGRPKGKQDDDEQCCIM
ncbi:hypothetical protein FOCC_FOCC008668 [Frankliniella occidentalis]|uniref:Uncharacterized protein LOC113210540 n=1 Tax=Frankliniella occidentalis TaxID=133901 RepID=A0A6J1SYE5_FRAOC|nr:uncharacterized protein LOC113210540 [Frankliniella occidentalis]KAE8744665.1 hypothetical protein FOCC_FOCC008668 [Frankliniella occidentalis]